MKYAGGTQRKFTSKSTELHKPDDDFQSPDNQNIAVTELLNKLEEMKEGICVIGCDGRIVDVNTGFERLTGYTRDELIGEFPLKIHPEKEKERISAGFKKCRKDHTAIRLKSVFLRKDNIKIPMQVECVTYPS